MTHRLSTTALVALALPLVSGCKKQTAEVRVEATRPAAASAVPLDRLAPGELPPGDDNLFGLKLPRGMAVQGRLKDTGLAFGMLDAEGVANYVRTRVDVERVEIGAARTIFPSVRIHGGPADRRFRIDVLREGSGTRLIVQDLTPAPVAAPLQGLSDQERWKRAGFSPDGKPLNPKALE